MPDVVRPRVLTHGEDGMPRDTIRPRVLPTAHAGMQRPMLSNHVYCSAVIITFHV